MDDQNTNLNSNTVANQNDPSPDDLIMSDSLDLNSGTIDFDEVVEEPKMTSAQDDLAASEVTNTAQGDVDEAAAFDKASLDHSNTTDSNEFNQTNSIDTAMGAEVDEIPSYDLNAMPEVDELKSDNRLDSQNDSPQDSNSNVNDFGNLDSNPVLPNQESPNPVMNDFADISVNTVSPNQEPQNLVKNDATATAYQNTNLDNQMGGSPLASASTSQQVGQINNSNMQGSSNQSPLPQSAPNSDMSQNPLVGADQTNQSLLGQSGQMNPQNIGGVNPLNPVDPMNSALPPMQDATYQQTPQAPVMPMGGQPMMQQGQPMQQNPQMNSMGGLNGMEEKDQNVYNFLISIIKEKRGEDFPYDQMTAEADVLYDELGDLLVNTFEPEMQDNQKKEFDELVSQGYAQDDLQTYLLQNIPSLEQRIQQILIDFRQKYLAS